MGIQTSQYFNDPDGDTLTFSAVGLPPGISINPTTGELTGTPTSSGSFMVTETASDGQLSTPANFSFNIAPVGFELIKYTYVDPAPSQQVIDFLELARNYVNSVLTTPLSAESFRGDPNYQSINVDIEFGPIDGSGNTIAFASISDYGSRYPKSLSGTVRIDTSDLQDTIDGSFLDDVMRHEICHVLGLGLSASAIHCSGGLFTGPIALAEYQALTGNSDAGVPMESDCGHFSEATFGLELNTPLLNAFDVNPWSRVTMGALEDIGYAPNYALADSYSLPVPVRRAASIPRFHCRVDSNGNCKTCKH